MTAPAACRSDSGPTQATGGSDSSGPTQATGGSDSSGPTQATGGSMSGTLYLKEVAVFVLLVALFVIF